jgi:hypothetical protein
MINPKQQALNEQAEQYRKEREIKDHQVAHSERKSSFRKKMIVFVSLSLLFVGIAWYVFAPGSHDNFAKCLTEKGAVMYGEDWCPYTKGQKGMFGKSFKYVDYVIDPNLKIRPTWEINGERYERVQSFQRLSALTGCSY